MNSAELEAAIAEANRVFSRRHRDAPEALTDASRDVYAERMWAAFQEINQSDYPAGMVPWLDQAYPFLYRKLIDTIPNGLHRLWSQHKPLDQFECVLREWVSTHEQGCALYRAHLARQENR